MKTLTFTVSDEAFFLLEKMRTEPAEYRDTEYETLEEFKKSKDHISNGGRWTEDWFLSRNMNGTHYLTKELYDHGLVMYNDMSWHETFVITKFGKDCLDSQ